MRAAAPMAEKTPAAKPAAVSNVASGPIKVKHGDTLSKIASETKPPEVSLERMLVAMYRTNEDAFDGNNMNRLKTGKILRIPEEGDLSKVGQVEAAKEIRAQVADWHAYRLRLAAASSSTEEQAPRQEASGKISTTVADKAPPAKESAKEVVRLSKGEAPGDKTAAGGNAKALQDKLHTMQEEAIARDKMLKDSNERIAVLEKNIKEMQRLLELKGQPVPPAKPAEIKPVEVKPLPASESAKPAPVAAPAMAPASAVAPTKPVKKPARKPVPVVTPPSMLDEILAEPLYLAAGAAALLALGGAGFMLARRRGKGGKTGGGVVESDSAATHIAEPVSPSPETGDFTHAAAASSGSEEPDDVDPISEADLFLNFGRDVQAEDILKDALKKNPGNQQVRLKLLSIYANRKDVKTFSVVARQVQESGDAAAWEQAAEMGRKLEPGNPMYGGDGSAAVDEVSQDEATVTQSASSLDFDLGLGTAEAAATSELDVPVDVTTDTSTGLDFDLGMGAPEEPAPVAADDESAATPDETAQDETSDTSSVMDFDLGLGEAETATAAESEIMASSDMLNDEGGKAQEKPLDFDITAEHRDLSAEAGEPMPSVDDLIFDVTATHPSPAAAMEEMAEPEAPAETEEAMAFTLDLPTPEEPAADEKAEPAREAALDLSEISLELNTPAPAPEPEEEAKDARWHDVATKLDLARAYQEMGDASGAKEILQEVLNEGDEQQRAAANAMMQQLS